MNIFRPLILTSLILVTQSIPCFSLESQNLAEQYLETSKQKGAVMFTPPEGWGAADPKTLPKSVRAMVLGKGKHELPPSINLGYEAYQGPLDDFMKMVRSNIESDRGVLKNLGTIRTQAGLGNLYQVDFKTKWGDLRELQVFLKKDDTIYIMTAAAIKDEFPNFYNDFFEAMRSLRINEENALQNK